jgi:DNA-binding MarR family transcriptional regulator
MSRSIVVPVIRELARCFQAFQRVSDANIRRLGLTPPQFDVVVTLGNTPGLSFKELGNRTLITKGTLTGVVDRLAARGLVERLACPDDGRSTLVRLTAPGEKVFREVFEPHLAYLAPAFESIPAGERKQLETRLRQLREALERQGNDDASPD